MVLDGSHGNMIILLPIDYKRGIKVRYLTNLYFLDYLFIRTKNTNICPINHLVLYLIGDLHDFEPWVNETEWWYFDKNIKKSVNVKCTSPVESELYCDNNRCNTGTCYNGLISDVCDCPFGWQGKKCETGSKHLSNFFLQC